MHGKCALFLIEGKSVWHKCPFAARASVGFFLAGSAVKARDGQPDLRLPLTLESFPQITITGAAANRLSAAKVALIALARKLLTSAKASLWDQTPFQKASQP